MGLAPIINAPPYTQPHFGLPERKKKEEEGEEQEADEEGEVNEEEGKEK